MTVTPKQSRILRDRFGDIAANEIVEVLNTVETNSLAELRALNEANAVRFESKLDVRFAQIDVRLAEIDARISEKFLAHTRWMVGAWTTVFIAILGLWIRK